MTLSIARSTCTTRSCDVGEGAAAAAGVPACIVGPGGQAAYGPGLPLSRVNARRRRPGIMVGSRPLPAGASMLPMKHSPQIVFRDLVPLPSLEGEIRERIAKLERFVPEIMSCHVTVESTGNRHHQGHLYQVKIDVRVPGEELVAGERQGHEQMEVAVRDAFDAMRRQLEDQLRRRRGQVKHHEPRPAARRSERDVDEQG